jgi:hypothetical protein
MSEGAASRVVVRTFRASTLRDAADMLADEAGELSTDGFSVTTVTWAEPISRFILELPAIALILLGIFFGPASFLPVLAGIVGGYLILALVVPIRGHLLATFELRSR